MKLDWAHWLYSLVAAFIGGGAAALSAGFAGIYTDPEHFNPANGVRHILTLMAATFVIAGIISVALYLKQSPLPPPEPKP